MDQKRLWMNGLLISVLLLIVSVIFLFFLNRQSELKIKRLESALTDLSAAQSQESQESQEAIGSRLGTFTIEARESAEIAYARISEQAAKASVELERVARDMLRVLNEEAEKTAAKMQVTTAQMMEALHEESQKFWDAAAKGGGDRSESVPQDENES